MSQQICAMILDDDYAIVVRRANEQETSNSRVVAKLVHQALAAPSAEERIELDHARETISMLENENGFLKMEFSRINEALSQRLLSDGRGSWWKRVFRR